MYTRSVIARPTRSDWFLLLILGLMWGTSYAFIKLGVGNGLPTFTLIATRLLIGFVLLATVVAVAREPLPRNPRTYVNLLVMAVINIVIPFTLITTAERSVPSAIAAIINGAVPLVVILLAALTFPDEPITLNRLAGLLVGYAGVVVIVFPAWPRRPAARSPAKSPSSGRPSPTESVPSSRAPRSVACGP